MIQRETQTQVQEQGLEMMNLLPCQVCCPLSSAVTLLPAPVPGCLSRGKQFQSHMGPSLTLQNISNQARNVSEMFTGAVKLIPVRLHQLCWKGRWAACLPGALLSCGHICSSSPPKTTGTIQYTLCSPDHFGQRQPVLLRSSCACALFALIHT